MIGVVRFWIWVLGSSDVLGLVFLGTAGFGA